MANARVVVSDANDATPAVGGIFDGLGFFLLRRMPQRTDFLQRIQANGGRVVVTEAQADYVIGDHYRQDCPPGSISYQFIEEALENGELPNPANHAAGPPKGAIRPAGSAVPGKGTRTAFTAEDDRVLWQWLERTRAQGGPVKGNKIYQDLEAVNPRHTFQAWRDRYIRRLIDNPPAGANITVPANPPPSPPEAPDQQAEIQAGLSSEQMEDDPTPEEEPMEDVDLLLMMAPGIEKVIDERLDEAWQAFAEEYTAHSATEWQRLWHDDVRPLYLKQTEQQSAVEQQEAIESSSSSNGEGDSEADTGSARSAKRAKRAKRKRIADDKQTTHKKKKVGNEQKDEPEPEEVIREQQEESNSVRSVNTDAEVIGNTSRSLRPEDAASITQEIAEVVILTSDINRDAQAQFDRELFGRTAPHIDSNRLLPPDLPTSDVNRAAEKQLLREFGNPLSEGEPVGEEIRATSQQNERQSITRPSGWKASSDESPKTHDTSSWPPWTVEEDGLLRRGMWKGMTTTQIIAKYNMKRSESAIRNRRRHLENIHRHQHDPSGDERYESMLDRHRPKILPTPKLRRAAKQQLPEALVVESEARSIEEGRASSEQGEHDTQAAANGSVGSGPNGPRALTEANLASQQAMHREKLLRGTDLPPDEDDVQVEQTQAQYAAYLRSLLPRSSDMLAPVAQEGARPTESADGDVDLPQTSSAAAFEASDAGNRDELALSTKQEIENTMDDLINWPDSPKQLSRKEPARSLLRATQFAADVAYPSLPATTYARQNSSSPIVLIDEPRYPSLPDADKQPTSTRITNRERSPAVLLQGSSRPPERDGSEAPEDIGIANSNVQEDQEDEELELSVPMPVGRWNLSSPAARSQTSQLGQRPYRTLKLATAAPSSGQEERRDEMNEHAREIQQQHVEVISSDSSSSSSSDNVDENEAADQDQRHALETQDIVNAETQYPDFHMPLPDDSDAGSNDLPNSSLDHPSSPPDAAALQSQRNDMQTQTLDDGGIDEYIARMVLYGYDEGSVIDALECTSMQPHLAELVLNEQKAGHSFPRDVPGVWSKEEDAILEGGNAGLIKQLEEKHTWDEVERRLEYLEKSRDLDEDG